MTRPLAKTNTEMNIYPDDERAEQLAQISTSNDDNAECAAADLFREFPPVP